MLKKTWTFTLALLLAAAPAVPLLAAGGGAGSGGASGGMRVRTASDEIGSCPRSVASSRVKFEEQSSMDKTGWIRRCH